MKTTALIAQQLAPYGVKALPYFDRLKIYVDGKTPLADLKLLLHLNDDNYFENSPLSQNEHLVYMLDLYRPEPVEIKSAIKGDCAITYIEIAFDLTTDCKATLKAISNFFNRHLVRIPTNRPIHHVNVEGSTNYFSDGSDPECFVTYDDLPSRKGPPDRCFHLENRFTKMAAVKKHGLITLDDLVKFDFYRHWDGVLDLRQPNFTELGKLASGKKITRQAWIDFGKKEWGAIQSIQKYLLAHPERVTAFPKMTMDALQKYLADALSIC
ncbi:MAG: hypothetical protein M0R33_19750 [Methylomonas sp.]|jgi:hypothetical protein|uniref:hypothetical protein n=1 Tax=Methylomonas sp. TaxID=418 RepID=UPI0025DE6AE7|nr:hypothetical protein [Methylomonas sp.]MCK9608681.1 hypothetical protein [Methylomonas sp.]